MCLAVPLKIVSIEGDEAVVSSGGLKRKVDISLLKGAKKGDYVLVHAGFAIEKVRESQARSTLRAIRDIHEIR